MLCYASLLVARAVEQVVFVYSQSASSTMYHRTEKLKSSVLSQIHGAHHSETARSVSLLQWKVKIDRRAEFSLHAGRTAGRISASNVCCLFSALLGPSLCVRGIILDLRGRSLFARLWPYTL